MTLSGIEHEWIKKIATDGLDWKLIKPRLRLDSWSLRQHEDLEVYDALPPCLCMLYDVRKLVYRNRTNLSRKALSPACSVKLWLDQIKEEGDKSMYKDETTQYKDYFLFAWCTRFQLKASVDSFTKTMEMYTITLDVIKKQLLNCSCPGFMEHQIACKHFYLVERVHECFTIKHLPNAAPHASIEPMSVGDMNNNVRKMYLTKDDLDIYNKSSIPQFLPRTYPCYEESV